MEIREQIPYFMFMIEACTIRAWSLYFIVMIRGHIVRVRRPYSSVAKPSKFQT